MCIVYCICTVITLIFGFFCSKHLCLWPREQCAFRGKKICMSESPGIVVFAGSGYEVAWCVFLICSWGKNGGRIFTSLYKPGLFYLPTVFDGQTHSKSFGQIIHGIYIVAVNLK